MIQHTALPGTYPATQMKTMNEAKQKLGFKSRIYKLKTYFHKEQNVIAVEKHGKTSKWTKPWVKKSTQVSTSNTVAIGTVFSLNVPITISNTTTHYNTKTEGSTSTGNTSVVQQLVILPPIQIYGFMFLVAFFLFVITFALLQVHRTISIIELAVDGITYTLVNFVGLLSILKSWV
ncbi:uncharacterized protein EV154DRAFT_515130 [Mucor mucedo]|uniref:uncharacterized protein n=1 Tax=Mucor mucedo TaxID=29922 RepID=UPI00221F88AF|nr:uncharacterized protein EV154DRAFT_515130 [Mucor mucedo]KAI7889294.1 hypothetical protein EV154DRAFT_515130 [Mucor mucedo]